MTRASTAARALGVLVVAVLLVLGPTLGNAVARAATASTAAEIGHGHEQCDECRDRLLSGTGTVVPRSTPGAPEPRATGGYPGTAVAATAARPAPAQVTGHDDHNRRLAALQVFRR
ncbi:hypothetical protein ACNTMW_20860 [Planosporangium sp. 12N6]|uniref:hypothetical protein n=1 Tax=Planosporangium spinosum TaxID=3402278 RepID=UPI003CF15892